MEIPSLARIKKELQELSQKELIELLLGLAKFNRDNKAFLYFKVFERDNPQLFLEQVKDELELAFMDANVRNYHVAKKSAQGIRRKLNKSLKLTKDKTVQVELVLFFCEQMNKYGFLDFRYPVLENIYNMQLGKAERIINTLHEDLQYDFQQQLEGLRMDFRHW